AQGPVNPNRSSLFGDCCVPILLFPLVLILPLLLMPATCHEHQRSERQRRPHDARRAQAALAEDSRLDVAAVSPLAGCPGNHRTERQDAVAAFTSFELALDHSRKFDDRWPS